MMILMRRIKMNEELDNLLKRMEKLELSNTQLLEPNSEAGDEFVRKELINAYDSCELRDAPMLEYVIRMFSDPAQWKEFYGENDLKHYYIIGEAL